jgi:hypothetical protein
VVGFVPACGRVQGGFRAGPQACLGLGSCQPVVRTLAAQHGIDLGVSRVGFVPARRRVAELVLRRTSVPVFLLLAGVAAVGAAIVAGSVTWTAVWIGVASSCLTGGLVDGSAQLEARQRDRAILRIAGMRIGYLHQRLLWIIDAVFGVSGEPADICPALRGLDPVSIDLTGMMPGLVPARTRLARALESLAQLEEALAVSVSLGTQTAEASRFEELDVALRQSHFYGWLKSAQLTPVLLDEDSSLAGGAADLLDAVQAQFRFFADLSGQSWRYGQLPASDQSLTRQAGS